MESPTERGAPLENEEKKANDEQSAEERDEMDDLDVSQQKAEDVKGGARRGRWPREPQP
jgi:hypothetical protein